MASLLSPTVLLCSQALLWGPQEASAGNAGGPLPLSGWSWLWAQTSQVPAFISLLDGRGSRHPPASVRGAPSGSHLHAHVLQRLFPCPQGRGLVPSLRTPLFTGTEWARLYPGLRSPKALPFLPQREALPGLLPDRWPRRHKWTLSPTSTAGAHGPLGQEGVTLSWRQSCGRLEDGRLALPTQASRPHHGAAPPPIHAQGRETPIQSTGWWRPQTWD